MNGVIVPNEEYELTERDCIDWLPSPNYFRRDLETQRLGQAWMNSLETGDYSKLTGSLYDPFYADDWPAVIRALRFLLEN